MLRQDMRAARAKWLAEVADDETALQQREQSDFLAVINHEAQRLDFHCLRHTCGAWLAMAGAHPKVVQTVMRHSVITLTMDTYGQLFPGQEADAVDRLPDMLDEPPAASSTEGPKPAPTHQRPLVCGQQIGQQSDGKPCAPVASTGNLIGRNARVTCAAKAVRKPNCPEALEKGWQPLASPGESSRGGTRTRTGVTPQGILSPQRLPFRHSAERCRTIVTTQAAAG